MTELLGFFEGIGRAELTACWIVLGLGGIAYLVRDRKSVRITTPRVDLLVCFSIVACAAIAIATGVTAVLSPPNSSDAMAYHMPRVVYWAEQRSVRFFPTPYLNQIMLQPFAEYVMLHLYVLAGGDRLVNLAQWSAFVVSIIAVSLAAGYFGANARGQAIAAVFCATIPAAVLASSGAKNDMVLAMWMTIAVCFAFRFAATSRWRDALYLGAAIGLALDTKATAYVFLPWVIAVILIARWRPASRRAAVNLGIAALCALAINAPLYLRNYFFSGSPMGYDSAQGNGFFRWRNETFGWKQTVSNAMRNVSEQLGARSERWNTGVYDAVVAMYRRLGIDPNDPKTTWRGSNFTPPKNANHEADAPNRVHLAFLLAIGCVLTWRALHRRDRERAFYLTALFIGFVAFCAYLKWQPFMARLFIPLFVASAPLAGIIGEVRPAIAAVAVQIAACLILLDTARRPALQNWVRPLEGPASVFRVQRDVEYFADMKTWDDRESFVKAAQAIAGSGCRLVGIDINHLQLEYPLIALIREREPGTLFVHTDVENESRRYRQPVVGSTCAVACLDCFGDSDRVRRYAGVGGSMVVGKFVVFVR